MKYSKLFGKTVREASSDATVASHKLLYQAGYIRESVAGRYYYLPLGMRVRDKMMKIIADYMEAAGSQRVLTPTLHPLTLWQETGRDDEAGFELMQVKDRRDAKFVLGGTAEEMIVDLVRKFELSYRDLPFNVYQFSTKFRDELRARGGLLRTREFTMKDAYSFDINEEEFYKEYRNMAEAYFNIYNSIGLDVDIVPADSGYIGGEVSHEFIYRHKDGESRYFVSEDGNYVAHEDIAEFTHEEVNPEVEVKDMEIVEQPKWVKTMEDNVKHYEKDASHFLKNVVYKTFEGDIVIAVIRGDLEVNAIKLQSVLGEDVELMEATDEDLAAIGTQSGYVHAWGHDFIDDVMVRDESRKAKVIYVADESLKTVKNFIGGQKEDETDSINVNYGRDFKHEIEGDIAMAQVGFLAPDGEHKLIEHNGMEVGNSFKLGYHYSDKMADTVYTSDKGKPEKLYMGCYGIGIGRTLASVVESSHDDKGIVWPITVAPYQVHFITIGNPEDINEEAKDLYDNLSAAGIEVLWDDRDVSPGIKFSDSELIGIPIQIVLSKRSKENGGVELSIRGSEGSEIIAKTDLVMELKDRIETLKQALEPDLEKFNELYDNIMLDDIN